MSGGEGSGEFSKQRRAPKSEELARGGGRRFRRQGSFEQFHKSCRQGELPFFCNFSTLFPGTDLCFSAPFLEELTAFVASQPAPFFFPPTQTKSPPDKTDITVYSERGALGASETPGAKEDRGRDWRVSGPFLLFSNKILQKRRAN